MAVIHHTTTEYSDLDCAGKYIPKGRTMVALNFLTFSKSMMPFEILEDYGIQQVSTLMG